MRYNFSRVRRRTYWMVGDRWCIVLIATNRQHPTPTNHLRVQSYNNKLRMKKLLT